MAIPWQDLFWQDGKINYNQAMYVGHSLVVSLSSEIVLELTSGLHILQTHSVSSHI